MDLPARVGRYELLERVGAGNIGVVYRGRDTVLEREVAVKIIAPALSGDGDAHARFFREAKAAARLQHANIVTIFEFGEHAGTPYVAMELLHGRSLDDRLQQAPPLSLGDKLDIAIQLCAGLDYAHASGVVHRDVKPGHVWVCNDGSVKLLDVGIATATSADPFLSDLIGNPGYMSPEQISGGEVDERSDIFSVGVILYEMFSGRRPFEADSPTGVMMNIVHHDAPRVVHDGGVGIPAELTAAIARSLQKSPAARYGRASELGRDLRAVKRALLTQTDSALTSAPAVWRAAQAVRKDEEVPAPSPPSAPASGQSSRSHTWLIAAGLVLVVGLLVWWLLA